MADTLTTPVFAHPARILRRATSAELLTVARERAADPAIFEEFTPWTWAAEISSNRLDAYYTQMQASSLRNYAVAAEAGVAFQDSHRTDGLERTFGHSLSGVFTEGDTPTVTADFYTLRGMDPGVDAFINKARAGIVRDVSIGFYGGRIVCALCGRDMWRDWDCWHIPGVEYEVTDEPTAGGTAAKRMALAIGLVEDAQLSEVSAVFDGATPGAAILKAEAEAERGRIRPEAARMIEARYRIHLPGKTVQARGTPQENLKEPGMDPKPEEQDRAVPVARMTELEAAETQLKTLRALLPQEGDPTVHIRQLQAEAADGRTYRTDLVTEALAEGVRAHGPDFDEATYRGMLEAAPLATIKRMRADWERQANATLAGGRQSRDADETAQKTPKTTPAPTRAYKA